MKADPFLRYGKVIVPFSALWTDEEAARPWWISPCPTADGKAAIKAPDKQTGKPILSQSHPYRQRWLVAQELCDLCGCKLKMRTKVSLSDEWVKAVGVDRMPLVAEPLTCKPCASLALEQCPHLQKRLADGLLVVRQVAQYKRVAQVLKRETTLEFTGMAIPGVIGHVRMALTRYKVRDVDWLRSVKRLGT